MILKIEAVVVTKQYVHRMWLVVNSSPGMYRNSSQPSRTWPPVRAENEDFSTSKAFLAWLATFLKSIKAFGSAQHVFRKSSSIQIIQQYQSPIIWSTRKNILEYGCLGFFNRWALFVSEAANGTVSEALAKCREGVMDHIDCDVNEKPLKIQRSGNVVSAHT